MKTNIILLFMVLISMAFIANSFVEVKNMPRVVAEHSDIDFHHTCFCTAMLGGSASATCRDCCNCQCSSGVFSCSCFCDCNMCPTISKGQASIDVQEIVPSPIENLEKVRFIIERENSVVSESLVIEIKKLEDLVRSNDLEAYAILSKEIEEEFKNLKIETITSVVQAFR